MEFSERSFVSDQSYRPRPFIYHNKENDLVIVMTLWGDIKNKNALVSKIENYIVSSQVDNEMTSPYISISSYSKVQNTLRIAVLMLNDYILKEQNSREYLAATEIFIGLKKGDEFYFTSHGHPHILISKADRPILPLKLDLDLSLDLSGKKLMPALPAHLIGINPQIEVHVDSLKMHSNDKMILLSRSWVPEKFLAAKHDNRDIDSLMQVLSKTDEQPFWIGLIEF